jgi:glutamate:GABA antiporter
LINMRGIHFSSKFASFCALTGLIIPMALIIGLFFVWLILGKPLQFHLTSSNIFPSFSQTDNWIALTAIITSFAGMELATVHIKDVNNPKKTFPRALLYSTMLILLTMILGSLAIAFVLPMNQVNLVNGTVQTFAFYLSAYHLDKFLPILILLLVIGSLGGVSSWVISPIKGMAQSANSGFLPPFLAKMNKQHMPQNLLLIQAVLVTFVCLAFLLLPSINGSYWLLTALSTQLYIIMYALMFLAAMRLQKKIIFKGVIPGKKLGFKLVCLLGLFGCLTAWCVGFIPPGNINIGSKLSYEIIFVSSLIAMITPVLFFYWYQRRAIVSMPKVELVKETV